MGLFNLAFEKRKFLYRELAKLGTIRLGQRKMAVLPWALLDAQRVDKVVA